MYRLGAWPIRPPIYIRRQHQVASLSSFFSPLGELRSEYNTVFLHLPCVAFLIICGQIALWFVVNWVVLLGLSPLLIPHPPPPFSLSLSLTHTLTLSHSHTYVSFVSLILYLSRPLSQFHNPSLGPNVRLTIPTLHHHLMLTILYQIGSMPVPETTAPSRQMPFVPPLAVHTTRFKHTVIY
jgi:hypothetical protein